MLLFDLCGNYYYVPLLPTKPFTITLHYRGTVRVITQTDSEVMGLVQKTSVECLLSQLFHCYPLLLVKCYPSTLKIHLNDTVALGWESLRRGDVISIVE